MWTVLLLADAATELNALPADQQARFQRVVQLIGTHGLEQLHFPHVRHLEGPIWEIRLQGKAGISRALYVVRIGKRVVVVRVFVKKSQTTPRREIDLALKRAKDLKDEDLP